MIRTEKAPVFLGEARSKNIVVTCCVCRNMFVMTCIDYVLKKQGMFVKSDELKDDGWCCPECAKRVLAIKNL